MVSLPDALVRYNHLLITGEAGAGKSTLASHLVRSLCGVWLRRSSFQDAPVAEPLIPLRLSASLLSTERGSWSERLRGATLSTLGGGLVADPPTSLFVGRTQGARWLIFVDGIDEIVDRRQRAELIRTLARHSHGDSDFRLVVMSRPLPPTELAPLHNAMLGEFEVQPFEQAELKDYTRRWFDQQRARVPHPTEAADRFLREVVEESNLKELMRNPLLATMALVNATLKPSLPPTSSRLTLYESFLERLRDRSTYSASAPFPVWLADSADELVRAMARLRTEGEEDLVSAGRNWMRQHPPTQIPLPAGWEGELPSALVGTGLLVVAGDQLRFLHQSFAEFLAAFEYAKALPADGDGLETWVRRACNGTQQSLALFVLCQWTAQAGCSPNLLIERVLAQVGGGRTLLAGSLMAEGLDVGPEHAATVIGRLIALARGHDEEESNRASNALSVLDVRYSTASILRELAKASELTAEQRFYAVSGLSRLAPPDVTAGLLAPLLELLYGDLPKVAPLAQRLGDTTTQAVLQRITVLLGEPDADTWELAIAAETYRALGATEEAARSARQVLEDCYAEANEIRRAAGAWLDSESSITTRAQVTALGQARPLSDHEGRMAIAAALDSAGAIDEAAELARTIVDARHKTTHAQLDAAEMWLRVHGTAAAEPVVQLFGWYHEAGCEVWRQARLLKIMVEAGVEWPSGEWAQEALSGGNELPVGSDDVIKLWLASHDSARLAELASLIGDGTRLHVVDRADYAQILLDSGLHDKAFRVAELALRSPGGRDSDYRDATDVLLKIDRRRAVETLTTQLEEMSTSVWGCGVLETLLSAGTPDLDELSLRIADHVLKLPDADGFHVQTVLGVVASLGGSDRIRDVADFVCRHPALRSRRQRYMAQVLASYGAEEAALVVWRHLMSVRGRGSESFGIALLEDVAQALTHKVAIQLVHEQLQADPAPTPFHRRRLERMLAWLAGPPARC
ncbi:hypothetical protein GCM10009555_097920 [Acrocarpospora macrocephala]|uniref:NACHT domain-containing protein n=1 Tax=Acrocarpospora macrocephala TaxID=150177 RepID=A0A5M3WW54_9ACTN|nr:NACHT domain-containing protein [Acrocarpospora macrocephala]GES12626.1 hypothetical protein Amac_062230 [Acrocarpospora macrocephala]